MILGPVGVGKTFIANALGHLACRAGFHVRMHRADALLRRLRESRLDNSRDALMVELTTIDLLIIDDFALEPMTRDESRDVYQLFVERNARAAPCAGRTDVEGGTDEGASRDGTDPRTAGASDSCDARPHGDRVR